MPGGDYGALARMRPIVTTRRRLLVAHGADLIALVRRQGDRVSVQIQLSADSAAVV